MRLFPVCLSSGRVMLHRVQRRPTLLGFQIYLLIFIVSYWGLELHCQSTNHDAGHQMTAGSLLMYSCDSVCLVTVVLLFLF